jgi:hypothetical protein
MPGTHITDRQVRRYMEHRRQGNTQFVAAAKSGFSERSAGRIEAARVLPSQRDKRPRVGPGRIRWWTSGVTSWCRCCGPIRTCGRTTLLEDPQR